MRGALQLILQHWGSFDFYEVENILDLYEVENHVDFYDVRKLFDFYVVETIWATQIIFCQGLGEEKSPFAEHQNRWCILDSLPSVS